MRVVVHTLQQSRFSVEGFSLVAASSIRIDRRRDVQTLDVDHVGRGGGMLKVSP